MTPGRSGVWGACRFELDPACDRYDWLVVYDDLPPARPSEVLACPPERTILVTNEPPSIKLYEPAYTGQFGHVVSSQDEHDLPHPRRLHHPSTLLWYYGLKKGHVRDHEFLRGPLPAKTADLSTVCSSKRQGHTLHRLRFDFTQALKKQLPDMEIFGHGVRPVADKAEALEPYRYHLVFENHYAPVHWTEKLADAFLAGCLPFYHCCPDAERWFPAESILRIDPHDVDASARRIRQAMADDEYSRRLPAILEARRRVRDELHLFAVIERLIVQNGPGGPAAQAPAPVEGRTILLDRRASRLRHPIRGAVFVLARWFRRLRRAR